MSEIARRLTIEHGVLHTQLVKQFGQDNASYTVHRIYNNLKSCFTNGIGINQFKRQHTVNVALVEAIVLGVMAQVVYICVCKVGLFGYFQKLFAIGSR